METISVKELSPLDAAKVIFELIMEKNAEFTTVTTNGQVGSFLQDLFVSQGASAEVHATKINFKDKPKSYKILTIKDTEIFVDPYMKWNDCRIVLSKDEEVKEFKIEHSNNLI